MASLTVINDKDENVPFPNLHANLDNKNIDSTPVQCRKNIVPPPP